MWPFKSKFPSVSVLTVRPGDRIVVTIGSLTSQVAALRYCEQLRHEFPDNRVILSGPDAQIEVVRKDG